MLIFSCFANKPPLQFVALCMNQFLIQLLYFMSVSLLGFGVLKVLKLRNESFRPRNLDFFFTSASATTVSSMSTVEMEVFSDAQLIVLTIMMLMGGEVFTFMVGLLFTWLKLKRLCKAKTTIFNSNNLIPLSLSNSVNQNQIKSLPTENLKNTSIKFLSLVVLGYLVVIHLVGVTFVVTYLTYVPSARDVLKRKGLKLFIFSIFTVVSTFANCGFVPTNENMVVFSKNSGLLLILIPQVLLGNTLFPSSLRFSVWILGKLFKKLKSDSNDLLKNRREIRYTPLLPSLHSSLLVATVVVFILLQFILFCFMDWNLAALSDLNSYQKVVAVLFETVNSRHTGETILDLSTISAASLVLIIVMMYLPSYTSFLPIGDDEQCSNERERKKKSRGDAMENLIFSQLSYLVIFIILICITERKMMKEDPLNFSVLNIVLEVISAYGNVGFSTGYSCARQLKPDGNCKDKWYGFSGKWSDEGKIILIVVMFFGRLKKFNMHGGRAWKLQ